MASGVARSQRLGSKVEVPQRGPGAEPQWGMRGKPPGAEKYDINFALRITLVNA